MKGLTSPRLAVELAPSSPRLSSPRLAVAVPERRPALAVLATAARSGRAAVLAAVFGARGSSAVVGLAPAPGPRGGGGALRPRLVRGGGAWCPRQPRPAHAAAAPCPPPAAGSGSGWGGHARDGLVEGTEVQG